MSYSLRGFCDASSKAYAAVLYLRMGTTQGIKIQFLTSKLRIVPLKKHTIPKLKLLAALLLAQIATNVTKALEPELDLAHHSITPILELHCIGLHLPKSESSLFAIEWWRYRSSFQ